MNYFQSDNLKKKMYNLAICIPTYKRTIMLRKLVLSIFDCNLNRTLINDVNIIVVDNDIDKTAEPVISELKENFKISYKIDYFNHPLKGIANVRNELIKKAWSLNPDFIIFIDDDEYVTSEWLNELVKTILDNNSDAARGPVLAELDKSVPDSISCWFKRESYANNSQIYSIATGNLILKFSSLVNYDVWFDSRFNTIGSSDTYFGIQILKKKAKVIWAANAITYETIPKNRANLNWLIKRIYRLASTYTLVLKLGKEYPKLLKKILVSFVYIFLGFVALILILLPVKRKYWGILKLTEGIGGLAGVGNILYNEYK
jgi:succinoglycan biosynthesis protein ExoM